MKGKMLVVIAIALGVVVVVLVNNKIKELEEQAHPPTRTFYRAAADISPGGTVKAALDDSHLLQPVNTIPEVFAKGYPDAVDTEIQWAKPMTISRPIRAGEFLMMQHLQPLSAADVKALIPAGQTAISFPVTQESSVGYQVSPGDLVDVYLMKTSNDPKIPGGVETKAVKVASDIAIWGVDGQIAQADGTFVRARGTQYSSITVTVPPEEVEKLLIARAQGKLTLTLKSKKGS
jgi:Flp pilus assembly protein CpaB